MSLIKELLERVEQEHEPILNQKTSFFSSRFLISKKKFLVFLLTGSLFVSIFLFINLRKITQRDNLSLTEAERRAIEIANESLVDAPVLLEDVVEDIEPVIVPSLSLKGIIFDPEGTSYAFVNDSMLKEKDNTEGVEILKIEQEKIEVMFNNKVYELALTDD